jgi:tyrosinase
MSPEVLLLTALLTTTILAGSTIPQKRQFPTGCSQPVQRRSWYIHNVLLCTSTSEDLIRAFARSSLSAEDKLAYINADKCLMNTPARYGVPGAVSVWDELQYAHIVNKNFIHGVVRLPKSDAISPLNSAHFFLLQGQFLLWHRYYVTVYERLMSRHCGWQGGVP